MSPHQEPHQVQSNYLLSLSFRVKGERLLLPALVEGLEGGSFLPCATLWCLEVTYNKNHPRQQPQQHCGNCAQSSLLSSWAQSLWTAPETSPHSTARGNCSGMQLRLPCCCFIRLCTWRGSSRQVSPGRSQRRPHALCSAQPCDSYREKGGMADARVLGSTLA